jgi:hypothetical protein
MFPPALGRFLVLWLTDLYGLDIRCVRLTPYRVGERLLLDVQRKLAS